MQLSVKTKNNTLNGTTTSSTRQHKNDSSSNKKTTNHVKAGKHDPYSVGR